VWLRNEGTAISTVASTGQKQALDTDYQVQAGVATLLGATLLRTHLHIHWASTAGGPNICRFGVIIEDQSSAGNVVVSGPIQGRDRDWLAIGTQSEDGLQALTGSNRVYMREADYDFKSRRRFTDIKMRPMLYWEANAAGSFTFTSDLLVALP